MRIGSLLRLGPLLLVLLGGCREEATPVRSDPYLLRPGPDRMTVAVVTDSPQILGLEWGRNSDYGERLQEAERTRFHRFELTDLKAETEYLYRLYDVRTSRERALGSFRTAPLPGRPFRFVALGDSGGVASTLQRRLPGFLAEMVDPEGDSNRQATVARAILGRTPDLMLHTGDVVYSDGALDDYPKGFFRPFRRVLDHIPFVPALGNHDAESLGTFLKVYHREAQDPGRTWFSLDYSDVHFVVLDNASTGYGRGSPQLEWLAADLAETDRVWTIVILHRPPVSAGNEREDLTDLHQLLAEHRVSLVLAGHEHNYQRFLPRDGVTYVITGGGGVNLESVGGGDPQPVYAEAVYHFVEVDVTPSRLTLRAIDAAGNPFDELVMDR